MRSPGLYICAGLKPANTLVHSQQDHQDQGQISDYGQIGKEGQKHFRYLSMWERLNKSETV